MCIFINFSFYQNFLTLFFLEIYRLLLAYQYIKNNNVVVSPLFFFKNNVATLKTYFKVYLSIVQLDKSILIKKIYKY